MNAKLSRQERVRQTGITSEALVERYQFVIAGHAEPGQIGVVPDLRREGAALSKAPPWRFNISGFAGETNLRIGQVSVVCLPGFGQCQDVCANGLGIGC